MVFLDDDGQYYLYVCTRWKDEAGQLHAAIGVASSRDRIHWEEAGIIRLPGCTECAESPFVMKRQGRYYLFYTNCGKGSAYAVSDNPISGWREKGLLLGAEDHSGDNAHVPSCICFPGKVVFFVLRAAARQRAVPGAQGIVLGGGRVCPPGDCRGLRKTGRLNLAPWRQSTQYRQAKDRPVFCCLSIKNMALRLIPQSHVIV